MASMMVLAVETVVGVRGAALWHPPALQASKMVEIDLHLLLHNTTVQNALKDSKNRYVN